MTGPAVAAASSDLEDLLHRSFGFASFRPGQEEICRTLIGGRDALVVMPTGSGKSLCYQLPGLALGGTTLVISPLIALMEDQVIKLQRAGFRAERIHSGRDRAASRQACVDYLNGALQFLFIAPERLRVPGFPEMLAKRKPSLVAIDEAHCISQWGHDFRPDYRMIGQHLPSLRPAAAVALTATATPLVQDDIHGQLGLGGERFIQGFRRDNIAIEVVESAPSRRADLVLRLLEDDERRPAIVYAPSRRETESIAALLAAEYPAAAYHAGMTASARDQVQSGFLAGHIEVIAATIAFGMGIDKPNIRTVIHTALPGSMEGYYQEIGRAGRDGKPSRAILMQAYSDRRTHDFFFERGYPDPVALKRLQSMLSDTPIPKDLLASRAKLTDDEFAAALEKLWVHGGAIVDYEENVSLGTADWQPSYRAQRQQKAAQLEIMLRYAESSDCRMVTMVRHFGDLKDARRPCGICDHCAPDDCVAQTFRDPDANERELAWRIVETLRGASAQGTGRLHAALGGDGQIDRNAFERLLGGLARAAYIKVEDASFEKDGKRIDFKKASLRHDGESASGVGDLDFVIRETLESEARPRSARGKAKPAKKTKPKAAAKSAPARGTAAVAPSAPPPSSIDDDLVAALKAWRLAEAKKQKIPAFRILTDKTLNEIADEMPETTAELLAIHGMGLRNVEKYGASIFRILAKAR